MSEGARSTRPPTNGVTARPSRRRGRTCRRTGSSRRRWSARRVLRLDVDTTDICRICVARRAGGHEGVRRPDGAHGPDPGRAHTRGRRGGDGGPGTLGRPASNASPRDDLDLILFATADQEDLSLDTLSAIAPVVAYERPQFGCRHLPGGGALTRRGLQSCAGPPRRDVLPAPVRYRAVHRRQRRTAVRRVRRRGVPDRPRVLERPGGRCAHRRLHRIGVVESPPRSRSRQPQSQPPTWPSWTVNRPSRTTAWTESRRRWTTSRASWRDVGGTHPEENDSGRRGPPSGSLRPRPDG